MRATTATDVVLTPETRQRVAAAIKDTGQKIGVDRVMLTAVVLSLHLNSKGEAYPSFPTLEDLSGIPARLLKQAVAVLEAAGVVEVDRASGRPNVYRFPNAAGMPDGPPSRDADETRQGTEQGTRQGTRQGTEQASLPRSEVKRSEGDARASADPPSRYCTKHPQGTSDNCRSCGDARHAYEAWYAARKESQLCPHKIPRGDVLEDGVSVGGCLSCEGHGRPAPAPLNLRQAMSTIGRSVA